LLRSDVWAVALFVALQSLWPNLFPYSPILGFAEVPELMQLAEIFGVHFVEAIVIGVGLCFARAITANTPRLRIGFVTAALLVPPVLYGYGHFRMAMLDRAAENAPRLVVGIVQPNVPVGNIPLDERLRRLSRPSAAAEDAGAELVVWPEAGAYPFGIERPYQRDAAIGPRRVLSEHRVQTIFGANTRERGARFGYNTVFNLGANGEVLGRYDKNNLVPFGEYIPLIDPDWVTDRIPTIAHHHSGESLARFAVRRPGREGLFHAAPLICYEDIIPGFVRDMAAQPGGVDLFVNVTIDAWYGDSAEPWEHLALAQFRSIEHRIPMVRSVSTGVSGVIDQNGRLVSHIPMRPVATDTLRHYPPEFLVESIPLARNTETSPTPYARFGWLFPHLCQLFVVIALARDFLERRRSLAR
jgi:apolipoprotein N-acyltransferase